MAFPVRTEANSLRVASTAASMAFSNAGLGAEHALAHSLGGHFDMAHGVIHPILLTTVMRFNLDSCTAKLADIGRVVLNKRLGTDKETALEGIEKLDEFFACPENRQNFDLFFRHVVVP